MKLSVTLSLLLIFACAAVTPLLVAGTHSFIPPTWIETTLGLGIVLFVLHLVCVGLFTLLCFHLAPTFGLHQVLLFSITALIVTRGKQLLVSTPEEIGIIEAGTLLVACLLVFCVTLFLQRKRQPNH